MTPSKAAAKKEATPEQTEQLANELHAISKEEIRRAAEHSVCTAIKNQFGDDCSDRFTADEIEEMVLHTMTGMHNRALTKILTKATFANVRNSRYWADIAIRSVADLVVKGAVIGVGVYAYGKLTTGRSNVAVTAEVTVDNKDPFSDKTPFAATPRPLRATPRSSNAAATSNTQTH